MSIFLLQRGLLAGLRLGVDKEMDFCVSRHGARQLRT